MTFNTAVYTDISTERTYPTVDKEKLRREFAQKLQKEMLAKGWHPAELARRARVGRDNISGYLNAKTLPGSAYLKRIADALGKEADYFIPGIILKEEVDRPMLEIEQYRGDPKKVIMRFVQIIPFDTAMKIMEIIKKDG